VKLYVLERIAVEMIASIQVVVEEVVALVEMNKMEVARVLVLLLVKRMKRKGLKCKGGVFIDFGICEGVAIK